MERDLPALGKIPSAFFDRVIFPRLGRPDPTVLVGPRHGVDIGIVDVGGGQVMAVTTDPFFIVPAYGWERAGWFAVHILASDLATSGLRPRYVGAHIGECTGELGVVVERAGQRTRIEHPRIDPFWEAFARAAGRERSPTPRGARTC